ncbi:MAG: hypothetical protein GKR89_19555 [Candidatus Latescibacteria bacterium]|nr:hypothetical protein [Candidatus Latescibacterota bacterium]
MSVPTFNYRRMVDLSRPIVPSEGRFVHYRTGVETIDEQPSDRWYIATYLEMGGHAGTHVEAPLHAVEDGTSIAELDVERFFGGAIVLNLSTASMGQAIAVEVLQEAAEPGGGVQAGDIVLLRFDWDRRCSPGDYPPHPSTQALEWLVGQGVKLVGIDSPGLDIQGDRSLPNHHLLFSHSIPLIESLDNLDQLQQARIYLFAQPLRVTNSDAVPLRVLAFEA